MKVYIDNLGMNGEGVFRIQQENTSTSKVGFVDYALPNEEVEVEIVNEKANYCNAKLINIYNQSSDRVEPKCKYFGICGGCDLQHLSEPAQLKFKQNKVKETINKFAKLDIDIQNTISHNTQNYRNKAVFAFFESNGKIDIGMKKKSSHETIAIDNCLLNDEDINSILEITREYFKNFNQKVYSEKTKKGNLKYLAIRKCNNQILVAVVGAHKFDLNGYYEKLKADFDNIGLSFIVNNGGEILGGQKYQLFGIEYIELNEFGINYKVDIQSFMQINAPIKLKLYEFVLNNISKNSNVIDAFSGSGLMSAIISKKAKSVIGIEINKSAYSTAKNLAKENNLNNLKFVNGDVTKELNSVIENDNYDTLVLDPPRTGVEKNVLNSILSYNSDTMQIKKIIYISCNSATLARDINILKEKYKVTMVQPFDMFPMCKDVETVCVMETSN